MKNRFNLSIFRLQPFFKFTTNMYIVYLNFTIAQLLLQTFHIFLKDLSQAAILSIYDLGIEPHAYQLDCSFYLFAVLNREAVHIRESLK
jgi:hypothetical protein